MIVELIVTAVSALVQWIGNHLPSVDVPGFVSDLAGLVGTVAGTMAPMGNWIPFGSAWTATQFVLLAAGVAVVIKTVRVVASFFTAGGGSAA